MNKFVVAVITPTHNYKKLERTILSVLHQSNVFIHYYIIDDSNDNNSQIIVKKFPNKSKNFMIHYYKRNKGSSELSNPSYSINYAIKKIINSKLFFEINGVCIIHDDDILFPESLLRRVKRLMINSLDVVWGLELFIDEQNQIIDYRKYQHLYYNLFFNKGLYFYHPYHTLMLSPNVISKLITYNNLFSEKYTWGEDREFFVRILKLKNLKYDFVKDFYVGYSIDNSNSSRISVSKKSIRDKDLLNIAILYDKYYLLNRFFTLLRFKPTALLPEQLRKLKIIHFIEDIFIRNKAKLMENEFNKIINWFVFKIDYKDLNNLLRQIYGKI